MDVAILGRNDVEKAQIIDQLDEYFDYVKGKPNNAVKLVLDIGIDRIAFLRCEIMFGAGLKPVERTLLAHELIIEESKAIPGYDLVFYFPSHDEQVNWVYTELLKELWIGRSVVCLPPDRDEAAELVRATVEGFKK